MDGACPSLFLWSIGNYLELVFRFQHVRHSCLGKVKEFNFKSGKIYNFERRQGKVTV